MDNLQLLVIEFHFIILYSQLSFDGLQIPLTCFQLSLIKPYPRKLKIPISTRVKSPYLLAHSLQYPHYLRISFCLNFCLSILICLSFSTKSLSYILLRYNMNQLVSLTSYSASSATGCPGRSTALTSRPWRSPGSSPDCSGKSCSRLTETRSCPSSRTSRK